MCVSWFTIGRDNFEDPVYGREAGRFQKHFFPSPGKEERKMHNKFHRDQMNGSWFEITGTSN